MSPDMPPQNSLAATRFTIGDFEVSCASSSSLKTINQKGILLLICTFSENITDANHTILCSSFLCSPVSTFIGQCLELELTEIETETETEPNPGYPETNQCSAKFQQPSIR